MNEIDMLKKLDAAGPPMAEIDIADRVMRAVRPRQADEPGALRPWWIAALLSSSAAAVAIVLAVQALSMFQDPFMDILTPIRAVFQ